MKKRCWFVDLTHTGQGVHSKCFPLGIGLVAEYAKSKLKEHFEFKLFKYPEELERECKSQKPEILCFSNFAWNLELSYKFIESYKAVNKNALIVMGGPNFPNNERERKEFLERYVLVDFYIFGEGELAFVNLMSEIIKKDFDIDSIKRLQKSYINCSYLYGGKINTGHFETIKNINDLPCPYVNHSFDEYFEQNLVPLYETTRGCPFSCSFCSDGIKERSHVCLISYLRSKYPDLAHHIRVLDSYRRFRHTALYALDVEIDENESKESIRLAVEFVKEIEKIL